MPQIQGKLREFVVSGFLRGIEDDFIIIIPDGVQNVIELFVSFVMPYKGIFIDENIGKGITKLNDHQLQLTGLASAKLDQPLPRSDEATANDIIYWKIEFTNKNRGSIGLENSHFLIGVVSQNCDNFERSAFGGLKEAYGLSGYEKEMYKGKSTYEHEEGIPQLKYGDVVCVQYHICESKLTFLYDKVENDINDSKMIGSVELPQNMTWYPAVSLCYSNTICTFSAD